MSGRMLDRFKARDARIIGSAISDIDGYLPTHLPSAAMPPAPDPVWNDEHCRNRRILMDETTRKACRATSRRRSRPTGWSWATDSSRSRTSSCLYFKGRRWGNFELAYRDE